MNEIAYSRAFEKGVESATWGNEIAVFFCVTVLVCGHGMGNLSVALVQDKNSMTLARFICGGSGSVGAYVQFHFVRVLRVSASPFGLLSSVFRCLACLTALLHPVRRWPPSTAV